MNVYPLFRVGSLLSPNPEYGRRDHLTIQPAAVVVVGGRLPSDRASFLVLVQ